MRHWVWFMALVVLAASCGTPTVVGGDPLHEWCRSTTPEDCYQGAHAIAAGLDSSCLAFGPTYEDVVNGCADDQPPVTTIPGPTSSTEVDTSAIERTAELALIGAHPDGRFVVAGLRVDPVSLAEAAALANSLGGELVAGWRTDAVCVTAGGGIGGLEPSRFARVDGVERAAAERAAADAATTPITGRHIVDAYWARMADEATALQAPGVMLAAIAVDVRIGDIPDIRADQGFTFVSLVLPASFEFSIDLDPVALVDCG